VKALKSILSIILISLFFSCATAKRQDTIKVPKENNGILVGIVKVQKINGDIIQNINAKKITFMDWYLYKEITVDVNKDGFFMMPIARTSMYWLRRVEFQNSNELTNENDNVDLASFISHY
jgi:hypothetical protein